ncbi:MAG: sigma-70 family RNA polymerase sigma factor [Pseudomonadota bacterium]
MSELSATLGALFENMALHRYLRKQVKSSHHADDVIQSVAEKLLQQYELADNPTNYTFRVAHNAAIDHLRSSATRATYESNFAQHVDTLDELTPERIVAGQQALAQLDLALRELPLLTQEMFILFHVYGLSQQSIAQHYNLHLSTVEKRLAKAKQHCFKRVADFLD